MRYRAILYRKDPPFTETVYATLLLEHARGHELLLNDPRGLRDANEKLFALRFPALTPPTAVLRRLQAIHDFCRAHSGACVFKPLDGCGGSGIFVLRTGDPNANVIVESATGDGSRAVIAQAWLPRSADGDKRIFLLDGEPIGALLRVPAAGEARANLHRGGTPQATSLTRRELVIARTVGAACTTLGLAFVGIDVIGALPAMNAADPDRSKRHRGLSVFIVPEAPADGHSFELTQPGGGRMQGRAIDTIGCGRGQRGRERPRRATCTMSLPSAA